MSVAEEKDIVNKLQGQACDIEGRHLMAAMTTGKTDEIKRRKTKRPVDVGSGDAMRRNAT